MTSPSLQGTAAGNPTRGSRRSAFAGPLILFFVAAAAQAATVDVMVRGPTGLPARGVHVFLHPPLARPEPDPRALLLALREVRSFRGQTDRRGAVRFVGLPLGQYTVSLFPLPGMIVQPAAHPGQPAPTVTVFEDDEHLGMEVRLEHGIPVTVELGRSGRTGDGPTAPRRRARTLPGDLPPPPFGPELHRRLRRPRRDPDPPPGARHLGRRGERAAGLHPDRRRPRPRAPRRPWRPPLELGRDDPQVFLGWAFEAPASLQGTVDVLGGPTRAVTLVAVLAEGGDWLADAERRGGSLFREVAVPVDAGGRYRFDLPAGVWHVAPLSERLLASDPEAHTVELEAGEIVEADFELELEERDEGVFRVQVVDPRRENLRGAGVQILPLYAPESAALAEGRTEAFGVELPLLPEADVLLVAGHPDYLEARRDLPDFRSAEVPYQSIELERGAGFRLRAVNLDGRAVSGVEWEIERLGPSLDVLLRDPLFLEAKRRRATRSDTAGRAWLTGFYPGTYRVRAGIPSRGGPGALFYVGALREPAAREQVVEILDREDVELVARQQPAAHLELELVCADERRPPPQVASALVIDLDASVADADEAREQAVVVLDEVPFVAGRLLVGPLEQGVYRLAVRPEGFSRWTWAFDSDSPAAAHPLQLDLDEHEGHERIDLGALRLECAPAVDVVPIYGDGDGPAARDLRVAVELVDPATESLLGRPDAPVRDGRFAVRGLPEGTVRVEIVLEHPHFLPRPQSRWRLDLELARGRFVEVTPKIEALGGAVRVALPDNADDDVFVRLTGQDGTLHGEGTFVASVPAGIYSVLVCGDAECTPPLRMWTGIEVKRRQTVLLEAATLGASVRR